MRTCILIVATLGFTSLNVLFAQTDSIIFKNNNYIIGEVKNMDRGVLTIETDFSDSDFKIEWEGIREIYTQNHFLIALSDGRRFNGRLESNAPDTIHLITDLNGIVSVSYPEVVFMKEVEEGFKDRLVATVDLGFSLTRANNLKQFTSRGSLGYLAKTWLIQASYSGLRSSQDEIEPIRRNEGNLLYRYLLRKNWFLFPEITFLSNTEQKLDLRTTSKLGIGKYVVRTNQTYWGFTGGLSFNYETFATEDTDRRSLEGFFGTELNLYDIGDLNLLTYATVYPSLTEKGRWRVNIAFDLKYDLPLDFYIKTGVTYNFDNQPVESASKGDYIFQTGFGWEW